MLFLLTLLPASAVLSQTPLPVTPKEYRGNIDFERVGQHDANRMRTRFHNYGMVGDYPPDPINVDLNSFHSMEVPRGSGVNYGDGTTPFVLARVIDENGTAQYIMLTGYRERQDEHPDSLGIIMKFEPRVGYFEEDPDINRGRSIAISNDPRTWPSRSGNGVWDGCWIDREDDLSDPGWCGSWNGYFGKRPSADQESYYVMDDDYYSGFNFRPDSRDQTRGGLGLRVEVRGFQWANPQAQNVIFWHYDVINESTTSYIDNIIFGMYMDSGVGGSSVGCPEGVAESDDDNAFYDRSLGLNLVYTWDKSGRGVGLNGCVPTGYLGYAYLETPGNPFDAVDNDGDGIRDERRDNGPGQHIVGQAAIRAFFEANYDRAVYEAEFGPLEDRPAYIAGEWWTGDEDMDWVADFHDTGVDGVFATDENPADVGERDGRPTAGEANIDQTDIAESDQIGLTGFKMNRIAPGAGNPNTETDGIVFYDDGRSWPRRLYEQFTAANPAERFDPPLAANYNIGFVFASGPFQLPAGANERFSLALAYGSDLEELQMNVQTVQQIYDANYQFATPPPTPTVQAFTGQGRVTLVWDNAAEKSVDPVSNRNDFEGYRIYRSTDPNFLDPQIIDLNDPRDARNISAIGDPIAQFDVKNGVSGYSEQMVQGIAYYLGNESGITHTWTDTTVTNGQTYYYAVTAYDHGYDRLNFYPSENSVSVSRTLRGGTILPKNVVQVRPNAPVPGYVPASYVSNSLEQVAGSGISEIDVRVLNSAAVQDGARYRLEFQSFADSIRAQSYSLIDVTDASNPLILFTGGTDLEGQGTGPIAEGILPVIDTPVSVEIDSLASEFTAGDAGVILTPSYRTQAAPINLRRPGYPEDLIITFADAPQDTSLSRVGFPARASHFKVTTAESGMQLNFYFRDLNGDGTLSDSTEFIDVVTYRDSAPNTPIPTWRVEVTAPVEPSEVPGAGDVYRLAVRKPLSAEDVFTFTVQGERIDEAAAAEAFGNEKPYVVPNPYTGAASFEEAPFAESGRGPRRMEFRAIPAGATIRIYTVRGELVQTLRHDDPVAGMVPWDLRTKDNLDVAPGLYLFHVDADGLGEHVGKFAIIK